MIISFGQNAYPSEVQKLLGNDPKIKDVAVIGLPHDKWGEAVRAVIVLHKGASATERKVLDWCNHQIAHDKAPKSVTFISEDQMPHTATGKLLHRVLRERYGMAAARAA